jgi:hypothetical protein
MRGRTEHSSQSPRGDLFRGRSWWQHAIWRWGFCGILCLGLPALGNLQAADNPPEKQDPSAFVREVLQNDIDAQLHDDSLWCFREQKQEDGKPQKTMEVCGTKQGNLERVISVDGRELSPAEQEAEDQRIAKLINHPAQLRAKQKKENEDAEQERALMKVVPDAFEFRYVRTDGDLVTLNFRPNPAFRPATRAASVFHHLEGTLVLDRKQKRLAEIVGVLTSEVRFMGGLLGHLDEGGTFVVKAGQVAPDHWDVMLMNLDLSGRAFFFKTIAVHEKESYTDYAHLPGTASLQQIAELLKKESNNIHVASR